jgi:hypothetical protein
VIFANFTTWRIDQDIGVFQIGNWQLVLGNTLAGEASIPQMWTLAHMGVTENQATICNNPLSMDTYGKFKSL